MRTLLIFFFEGGNIMVQNNGEEATRKNREQKSDTVDKEFKVKEEILLIFSQKILQNF